MPRHVCSAADHAQLEALHAALLSQIHQIHQQIHQKHASAKLERESPS
jgi:hypothetical protein